MTQPSSILALAVETKADPASLADLSRRTNKAVVDAMKKSAKQTSKLMGLALEQAATGGMFTRGLITALRSSHKKISDHLAKSTEEGARKGLGKAALWMGDKMSEVMQDSAKRLEQSWKRERDRRKAAARELKEFRDKEVDEQIERYAAGIGGAAAQLTSSLRGGDLKGLTDLVRSAGQGIRQRGRAAAEAGASPDAGAARKMLGVIGNTAAKLGTAVAAVGALAGGIALVVKVLLDVEAVAKDMNKSFLESGGAINNALGAVATTGDELNTQLRTAQQFMTDTELSREWHASSEEIQSVIKGLNEGGMSVRRLTAGIKSATMQMKALRDATEFAMGYGLLLGQSSEQVASAMSKVSFETGTVLQRVAEGMSSVAAIAKESGFEVKRFYAAVLEATTGMGMYNVRIEAAAGLLKTLSKVLGETVAGDFLKSLNATFSDSSMTEKWKHAVLGGLRDMMGLMTADAADEQRALAKDLKAMMGEKGTGKTRTQAEAVETFFGDIDDMARRFGKMSRHEFAKAESAARAAGVDPEMLNQINRMFELAQGGKGKGRTIASMGLMDPTSKLVHRIREAEKVTGLSNLINAQDKHLAAIEAAVGLSAKDTQALLRLQQAATGDLANLRKIARGTSDLTEDQQKAIMDMYHVAVENGKIINRDNQKQITNEEDLLLSSEKFAELAGKMDVEEDIRLAREISKATKSTANVIKNLMLKALLEIAANTSGALEYIKQIVDLIGFFLPGERQRARDVAARAGARAVLESGAATAESRAATLGAELAMLGEELATLGEEDKKRRREIGKEIELKSEEKEALESYAKAQKDAVAKIDEVTGMWTSAEDVARAALSGTEAGGKAVTGFGTGGPGSGVVVNLQDIASHYMMAALDEADEALATDLFKEAFTDADAKKQIEELRSKLLSYFTADEVDRLIAAGRLAAASVAGGEEGEIDVEATRSAAAERFAEKIAEEAAKMTRLSTQAQGIQTLGVGTQGAKAIADEFSARAKQAQDFIITKGGDFVRSDPADTIIGTRGGAGSSPVQINIYGGDQRQVYTTVREVLRISQAATA